jgi:hypothetical protein
VSPKNDSCQVKRLSFSSTQIFNENKLVPSAANSNSTIMTTLSRNMAVPYQDYFSMVPQRGNGVILNAFDVYSIDGSHRVESMSSILEGVSMTSSEMTLTTMDDSKGYDDEDIKPRLRRESTALMLSEHDQEQFVTGQPSPTNTHFERMGSFLSAQTPRPSQNQVTLHIFNKSNPRLKNDDDFKGRATTKPKIDARNEKFIVWQIIPMECERKFGSILFKFSTSNGFCFLLKYKYAVQFVQLLQKKMKNTSCSVFYQAFEYHGNASSIFKADDVTSWLGSTITVMQPPVVDGNGRGIRVHASIIKKPSEMSSLERINRYWNRLRLKKLIRRHLAQTFGGVKRSRGRRFFGPLQLVWDVLTGKSRSSF